MGLTNAQQAASYYARKRRRDRADDQKLTLGDNRIAAAAANGTAIGQMNVRNGEGTYTFTLSTNPGSLFQVDGAILEKAGALSAGSYTIGITADNGVDTPIVDSFRVVAI